MITVVLDTNVIVPGHQRGVPHFVALLNLRAVHGHLGRAINGDGQSAGSSGTGVNDEVRLVT